MSSKEEIKEQINRLRKVIISHGCWGEREDINPTRDDYVTANMLEELLELRKLKDDV